MIQEAIKNRRPFAGVTKALETVEVDRSVAECGISKHLYHRCLRAILGSKVRGARNKYSRNDNGGK